MGDTGPTREIEVVPETPFVRPAPVPTPTPAPVPEPAKEPVPV
jgi:hypothetical protein